MATKSENEKWSIKDRLEMLEAIFTIIVSVMAIWGTIVAWENGLLHEIKYIADHMHAEYAASDVLKNSGKKLDGIVQKLEKQI